MWNDPRIETLREMIKVQGRDGTWNYDPYFMGMYNGMEYALSIFENREPVYKSAPVVWLRDSHNASFAPTEADHGQG